MKKPDKSKRALQRRRTHRDRIGRKPVLHSEVILPSYPRQLSSVSHPHSVSGIELAAAAAGVSGLRYLFLRGGPKW